VAAVNLEIRVGGEKEGIGQNFSEADQTGVGDAHRDIGELVQEIEDGLEALLMERENPQGRAAAGKAEGRAARGRQEVVRLGKSGLTGDPWRRIKAGLVDGP